jgi:hypothetical protein
VPGEADWYLLDAESLPEGFAEGAWEGLDQEGPLDADSTEDARSDPQALRCRQAGGQRVLDLQVADREALEAQGLWSPQQTSAFLEHRQRYGPLDRLEELQSLPGFTPALLRRQAVCFRATPRVHAEPWYRVAFAGPHRLLWRMEWGLERPKAFRDSTRPYAGDRSRQVLQYRYRHERLEYGLTLEKDAGEAWWSSGAATTDGGQASSSRRSIGPDFSSGFLHWRKPIAPHRRWQWVDALVGDYALRFGQGLVHWSSFGIGKGSQAVALVRSAPPLQRYAGLDENRFLRGAALRAAKSPWRATAFASRKRLDANGSDSLGYSSLRSDGFHRSKTEQESRDALGEQLYGGLLQWEGLRGQAGILLSHQRYHAPIRPAERLDNGAAFRGRKATHAALHARFLVGNAQAFGEAALLNGRAEALLLGWQTSLHPNLDATLLWRHYDTAYHAPYGMGFAEGSTPRNETGTYLGLRWAPNARWALDAYLDLYRSPWLRYLVDAPSRGWETRAVLRWKPKRHAEIQLRLRWERKQATAIRPLHPISPVANGTGGSGWAPAAWPGGIGDLPSLEEGLEWIDRGGLRLHLVWPIEAAWRWQARVEGVLARDRPVMESMAGLSVGAPSPGSHGANAGSPEAENSSRLVFPFRWGWSAYQDLRWAPLGSPFRVHLRAMVFRTAL